MECNICKKEFSSIKGLRSHLSQVHKEINQKDYYIIVLNNPKEICEHCGNEKIFSSIETGYLSACSSKECRKDQKTIKQKETFMLKYGVDNPQKLSSIKKKSVLTKKEKYGEHYEKITNKIILTKKEKYGNTFGKDWNNKVKTSNKLIYGNENYNNRAKAKDTCLEKYGVEHPLQEKSVQNRIKKTNQQRYSKDSIFQTEEFKENLKKNNLEKYGKESYIQSEDFKVKTNKTLQAKYGVDNAFKAEVVKDKIKYINKRKYGHEYPRQNLEKAKEYSESVFKDSFFSLINSDRCKSKVTPLFTLSDYKGSNHNYKWKCNTCNKEFKYPASTKAIPRCYNCYPANIKIPEVKKEVIDFLEGYIAIEKNNSLTDIYIPDKKIAIDINGILSSSEILGEKDNKSLLSKTKYYEGVGIQLISIFESEWIDKQDIVKSILLSKISKTPKIIGARNTTIKEVSKKDTDIFLNNNHLQGEVNSLFNIGLYYREELVSILCVGKSRFNKKHEWELLRFCNKINLSVLGGFTKLLNYFITKYKPSSIVTYADRRYYTGSIYSQNNFKLERETPPKPYYTKDYYILEHWINYEKHRVKDKLKIFNRKLTAWQNLQLNDYDRIWDCGSLQFTIIF